MWPEPFAKERAFFWTSFCDIWIIMKNMAMTTTGSVLMTFLNLRDSIGVVVLSVTPLVYWYGQNHLSYEIGNSLIYHMYMNQINIKKWWRSCRNFDGHPRLILLFQWTINYDFRCFWLYEYCKGLCYYICSLYNDFFNSSRSKLYFLKQK